MNSFGLVICFRYRMLWHPTENADHGLGGHEQYMTNASFRQDLDDEFGAHTLEACARPDGKNAKQGVPFRSKSEPYEEYHGKPDDNILVHPPYSDIQPFLDHTLSLHKKDR